jgi:two-component sensor histidine kinase
MKAFDFRHTFFFLLALLSFVHSGFAQEAKRDSFLVNSLVDQAVCQVDPDVDSARTLTDSALVLAYELDHKFGQMKCLSLLGMIYNNTSDFVQARDSLKKGLKVAKEINSLRGQATIQGRLGLSYCYLGFYAEAIRDLTLSKDLFEALDAADGKIVVYNNLAIVYKRISDTTAALESYRQSLHLAKKTGRIRPQISALVNISIILTDLNKLDSALVYQNQALELAKDKKSGGAEAYVRTALAQSYLKKKQYKAAEAELATALPFYEQSKDRYRQAGTYTIMGNLKLQQFEYRAAIRELKKALSIAQEIQAIEIEKNVWFHLSRGYEKTGQAGLALEAFRKFHKIDADQDLQQLRAELEGVRTQFEMEKNEKELAQLTLRLEQERLSYDQQEVELEKQNLQLSRSRGRTWLLLGIGLVLMLLTAFLYYRYRDNRRHTALLQEKQSLTETSLAEKEVLLGEIHHRVKNNLQLVYNMLDLQSRTLEDDIAHKALKDSMNRVSAMAMLHQRLYLEDGVGGVRMPGYIKQLMNSLYMGFQDGGHPVEMHFEVEDILLDIDSAIPIGLIVNELATNSFKYGLKVNGKGKLKVSLNQNQQYLVLEVADNGPGLPDGIVESGNFGMRMVRSLGRQLRADIQTESEGGALVRLRIKKYKLLQS